MSIEPEIQAVKEFGNDDVKIINYKVTVTQNPEDYNEGRANGESLVHDYVNPDDTSSDADAVIISHSHNPNYGEGFFYLATPGNGQRISKRKLRKISQTSDFNYYPVTGNETYKSTSAVLVSKPIAQADILHSYMKYLKIFGSLIPQEKQKNYLDLIAQNI